jgi:hypothetical protein
MDELCPWFPIDQAEGHQFDCDVRQEEEAAEVNALADEADVPLEQLLAQYGFRIGPDGTKQRILDDNVAVDGMEPPYAGALTIMSCLSAEFALTPLMLAGTADGVRLCSHIKLQPSPAHHCRSCYVGSVCASLFADVH